MRSNSLLQGLVTCATAAGPLSAIPADTALWRAWIEFASCNCIKCYVDAHRWPARFILPCAFLCVSMEAQAHAALTALRENERR